MKKPLIALAGFATCLFLASAAFADDNAPKKWTVGTELDVVPYVFNGYYVSAVAGCGQWRTRFVRTAITTPGFETPSGFDANRLHVYAYIVDYYFRKGFKGWWVGPGFETWHGEVQQRGGAAKRTYQTDILTLGAGYTFRFNDHVYLNPWAALHIPVGGDRNVEFPGDTFKIGTRPEASVKIGLNF